MAYAIRTGRDPSWLVIASVIAPDIDVFAVILWRIMDFIGFQTGNFSFYYNDFNTPGAVFPYGLLLGMILSPSVVKFRDAFIFGVIRFGPHFLEDAIV